MLSPDRDPEFHQGVEHLFNGLIGQHLDVLGGQADANVGLNDQVVGQRDGLRKRSDTVPGSGRAGT